MESTIGWKVTCYAVIKEPTYTFRIQFRKSNYQYRIKRNWLGEREHLRWIGGEG